MRVSRSVLEERKVRLLEWLASQDGEFVAISCKDFSACMDLTAQQLRGLVRTMAEDRQIVVQRRHHPNGGQMENAYALTAYGKRCLEKALLRRATLSAGEGRWTSGS